MEKLKEFLIKFTFRVITFASFVSLSTILLTINFNETEKLIFGLFGIIFLTISIGFAKTLSKNKTKKEKIITSLFILFTGITFTALGLILVLRDINNTKLFPESVLATIAGTYCILIAFGVMYFANKYLKYCPDKLTHKKHLYDKFKK